MLRALAVIVAGILHFQPSMSESRVRSYAELVQKQSVKRSIDPITVVAIIGHESRWLSSAEDTSDAVGLGQHRLSNYPECQQEPGGDACAARRRRLLDPYENILATTAAVTTWRRFCRKHTGRALFHHWLAGYQGLGGKKGHWCGQDFVRGRWRDRPLGTPTRAVMRLRSRLIALYAQPKEKRHAPR